MNNRVYTPKNQSLKIIKLSCALIAADDVRLLVYRTVVFCSRNLYPLKNKFLATPLIMRRNMFCYRQRI